MRCLVANSLDIFTGAGVDLDDVPFLDEARHDEFAAGFNLGRFGDVGCRVTFGTWLTFRHQQFDVIRRRQDDGITIENNVMLQGIPSFKYFQLSST